MKLSVVVIAVVSAALAEAASNASDAALTVRTSTGVYTGLTNSDFPSVREFRNIPYAQPPVGKFRFRPPQPLPKSSDHRFSYRFPPSCPQFLSSTPSFWNTFGTQFLVQNGAQNESSGLPTLTSSEDCLSLAIWTPHNASASSKLPVVFFMTGGGFQTGGVDIPAQKGQAWVGRTQAHIVVTINYRVNIFGFPNAAALDSPNLGILDQRLALEWVAENIAAFGGDPGTIMIWGQSAGSISADFHNFAFWDRPIHKVSFSQSGNSLKPLSNVDYAHTNFTFVAKSLGCDFPAQPDAELECMQQVPMQQIEEFIGTYSRDPGISFSPIADEVVVFSNYTARALAGNISRTPALLSDVANNDASLTAWPVNNLTEGPYQPTITAGTLSGWVCPTANLSQLRHSLNLTTYRYQYAGNFSNQTPLKWLGAYHDADLPMLFGLYDISAKNTSGVVTDLEIQTSQAMQDRVLALLRDPHNGPPSYGWHPYVYGASMPRFGADGVAVQNVSGYLIDGPCYGNGTYNPFP